MNELKVRLIHETNPRKYYPAIFELENDKKITIVGEHRYSVVKEWLRAYIRENSPVKKRTLNSINDLLFRINVPFIKGEKIVMGFAPWDWRILIYKSLVKNNYVIYHTSWHDWREDKTPRQPLLKFLNPLILKAWKKFLNHENVRVVSVTDEVKNSLLKEMGVSSSVVPHAVPSCFFKAKKINSLERNSKSNDLKLLYVGELSEKKGLKDLLNIYRIVEKRNVSLTIVGNGPLLKLIEQEPGVNYIGPVYDREKLAKVMAEHDILVLLSKRTQTWEELFGIVIVEAIAAGCAVLTSDHIGPRGILGNSERCGVFSEKNYGKIADLIESITKNKEILENLKVSQNVAYKYSSDKVKESWIGIIKNS